MSNNYNELFSVSNTITEADNQTHIIYKLNLDKAYKTLLITYKYDPLVLDNEHEAEEIIKNALKRYRNGDELDKELDNWREYIKLTNLLTLSFDDANGFRGCAHRKNNNEIIKISMEESSPGMISGLIDKGEFIITLSIHALVTKTCRYSICICGEEA